MFRICKRNEILPRKLVDQFRCITPSAIGHLIDTGFMREDIKPLRPDTVVIGTAITVQTFGRDSTVCHKVIDLIAPGDIIVIDRGGDKKYACWGEMISLAAQIHGAAGVIVDGPVTDIQTLRKMEIPIFCTGAAAATTQLLGVAGAINLPITCGGVVVLPGDLIFGDDNGIIVIRAKDAEKYLSMGIKEEEGDGVFRQKINEGKTSSQIFALDDLIYTDEKKYP